jgi:hypothetical protein
MEFEEYKTEEKEEDYVDIYSKRAIFIFSIFSNIYGGVLLIINLWNAGYKKAISQVLLFLAGYYYLSMLIIKYSGIKIDLDVVKKASTGVPLTLAQISPLLQITGISLLLNVIAGLVLTQYFFKKYFPDDDYYARPIWRPLVIYILLALFSRALV